MKRFFIGALAVSIVLGVSGLFFVKRADAIPPFARKYQTACPTCHVVIPRLNPFGRAFRANGYRIPGGADEVFTKDEPLLLGANPWKKMFPNTIWPSDIPGKPPLGIEVITGMTVAYNDSAKTEFTGIDELALLMGGTLGESWSFFGDVNLFKFSSPKLGWIDRMFIQYNPDWFDGKGHVNIRAGEFEPRIVGPFSNHRQIQIMSWFMGYLNTTMPVTHAFTGPNNTVQTFGNQHGLFPTQKGVEVYGGFDGKKGGGWEYALGVVNGEAAHVADIAAQTAGGTGGSEPELFGGSRFDFNDQKDWYVSLHYKFGGMGVLGGGEMEELAATDNWQDNNGKYPSVKIGGYFYSGSSDGENGNIRPDDRSGSNADLHFTRAQVDIDIFWNDFNLFAGYTIYHDVWGDGDTDYNTSRQIVDQGDGTFAFEDVTTIEDLGADTTMNIFTAELDYVILPWLVYVWKHEMVQSDFAPTFSKNTTTITALIRANIKFQAGVQFSSKNAPRNSRIFDDTFSMGIQYDF